jgi:hypothetical protein
MDPDSECINFNMMAVLSEELNDWYHVLPEHLKFDQSFDYDVFPKEGPLAHVIDDHASWIRCSYWSCFAINAWPAAMDAVSDPSKLADPRYRDAVRVVAEGAIKSIASTSQYLDKFHPVAWSQTITYDFVGDR